MKKLKTIALTKEKARKYLRIISNKKHLTFHELSLEVGIMEDILREQLSVFDPMVRMFEEYDVVDLIPSIEEYLVPTKVMPKRTVVAKKNAYESIGEFVYANMTVPGGIVDRGVELNLSQLKALRKLVNAEIKEKKTK
jgi:hypothetical protein